MAADRHEVRRIDVGDGIYVLVPVPQLAVEEAAASGAGLGQTDAPSAAAVRPGVKWVLLGFLATAPVALAMLARRGTAARKATIPLGPFLALGATVVLLF